MVTGMIGISLQRLVSVLGTLYMRWCQCWGHYMCVGVSVGDNICALVSVLGTLYMRWCQCWGHYICVGVVGVIICALVFGDDDVSGLANCKGKR